MMRIINNTSKTIFLVNGKSIRKYSSIIIEKSKATPDLLEQLENLKSNKIISVIA